MWSDCGIRSHTYDDVQKARLEVSKKTTVAAPDLLQLIDEQGVRHTSYPLDEFVADVSDHDLLALYTDMRVIRRVDDEATILQRQGQLALWPPLRGQEAAQIGSGRALAPGDFVFSSYREHGVAYLRGVDWASLMRVWRGVAASGWDPYEVGMATPQVIIGAQTLHATGWAMGAKFEGTNDVAIAYFGDGAMSQGDVNEALVFAASYGAPVVFFCQNNHWGISTPTEIQSKTPLADRSAGFGVAGLRVDGNDVLAVLAATRMAVERARSGGGPTLIEAVTYRMGPHTTADDPKRYRPAEELEIWAQRDPIDRLEKYLEARGVLAPEAKADADRAADEAAAELRVAVIAMSDPEPLSLFDNVYATAHPILERQRSEYAAYLAGFAS